jgi:hypothetical protein
MCRQVARWFETREDALLTMRDYPTGKSKRMSLKSKSSPRFAIVTDVGNGMRWTLIVPLTNGAIADGEVVWS